MVNQTIFRTVTNGDQLSQGYFNGIITAIGGTATTVVHANEGITTASTEVELDTKTVSIGTFTTSDIIKIRVHGWDQDITGSRAIGMRTRISDGVNTHTSPDTAVISNNHAFVMTDTYFNPALHTTTKSIMRREGSLDSTSLTISDSQATMIANWIGTAITISLRGKAAWGGGTSTLYWNWIVEKLRRA